MVLRNNKNSGMGFCLKTCAQKAEYSKILLIPGDDSFSISAIKNLAINFNETKKPSGSITLEFSGNKAINLLVENIEVFLTDIGDPWKTNKVPDHNNE